jgi:hypothetical protein
MKKVNIKWLTDGEPATIHQVYKQGLEYSVASCDNRQCFPFVWCKDFIQDAIMAMLHQKRIEVYNFVYDPAMNPTLCLSKTRILLANEKAGVGFASRIGCCIDFIHQIESLLHFRPTKCHLCDSPPARYGRCGVWLLEGSRRWIMSPPLISLYTLLIRMGFVHTYGDYWANTILKLRSGELKPYQMEDHKQIGAVEETLLNIIRIGDRKIFYRDIRQNYPNLDIKDMHHRMGIVSFSEKTTKQLVPRWHRLFEE